MKQQEDKRPPGGFTHFDQAGRAWMVDVGNKQDTARQATAAGRITMSGEAYQLLKSGRAGKGDVLGIARIAGIMAAKKTGELIPLCHPLNLNQVTVDFQLDDQANAVAIEATASLVGKTGVEMEALTAVSVAALTIYDMCKAVDKSMTIDNIRLLAKSGGKSGTYQAR
ncbi:cyclic pyranopterin monophosphate synthase MoaC [Desulfurivibrio alkaliphilus]|uniref:Cyclic pyranopterin monophosphate synthase n=1 Tax=Desulfurivibrio alkaliphilus (strain DSM 19089 / UNIQEM U267 / AHT2) TaxID=589865 RepID=D6Z4C0_DESAT|nr:cyclic pyranopterin monophosphate synthase MoaC [Desulfurivibrio alkaliphilus]ADH86395.1 molybdenum cofactor biosynthesis protein C [Desulfurivibrio alkaliphilus AHT 2]